MASGSAISASDSDIDDDKCNCLSATSATADSDNQQQQQQLSTENALKQDFTVSSVSTTSDDDDDDDDDDNDERVKKLTEKFKLQNIDTEVVVLPSKHNDDKQLKNDEANGQKHSDQQQSSTQNTSKSRSRSNSISSSSNSSSSSSSSSSNNSSSDSLGINATDEEQITKQLIDGLESELKLTTDDEGNKTFTFDINSDSDANNDGDGNDDRGRTAAENEVLEQVRKILIRRDGKQNKARQRWLYYERKQKEAEEQAKQFEAYWNRRHQEDRDLWRDKDFANAVDKMSRAGYVGAHGSRAVPAEVIEAFNALYMQITFGDYDGNDGLECAEEWKKLKGKGRIECQRDFIKKANRTITKYGWNPPPGWK